MANERKKLPALDNAAKVKKPDLPDIADKNYTDKILKYGGLATRFPQLNTNAKTVVAAINELQAGGSGDGKHRTLTQAEYDELTPEEKMDGTIYFIIDAEGPSGGVTKLNELEDVIPPELGDNGALLYWDESAQVWQCIAPDNLAEGYTLVWNSDGSWNIRMIRPEFIQSEYSIGNIMYSSGEGSFRETQFSGLENGTIMSWDSNSESWKINSFTDLQSGDMLVWNGDSSWVNVPAMSTPIIENLQSEEYLYSTQDGTIIQYDYYQDKWIVNSLINELREGDTIVWDAEHHQWKNISNSLSNLNDCSGESLFNVEEGDILYYGNKDLWTIRQFKLSKLLDCSIDAYHPNEDDVLTYSYENGEYVWVPKPPQGGGGEEYLKDLKDCSIDTTDFPIHDGQVLTWTTENGVSKWRNINLPTTSLNGLSDVTLSSIQSGQVLKYNGTKWVNANESGGVSALTDLTDVTVTSVQNGQELVYNSTSSEWENREVHKTLTQAEYDALVSAGTLDMNTIYFISDGGVLGDASDVDYDNTTSGLTATNVQDALDEIVSDIPAAQVNSDWNAVSGVAQILNKPNLASVATSGDYDDLTNKPTIPAAQVNSDWNSASGVSQILNKPTLATVATSGDYTDLTNKPTIPAAQVNSDWESNTGVSQILHKPNLATVATSGSYSDLSNTPTLGTAAAKDYTTSVISGSTDLVTAGAVFSAIDNLPEPIDLVATLVAGQTSLTFTNSQIKVDSTIDVYTDTFGVNPTNVTVMVGQIVLTFPVQQSNLGVKVRLT